MIKLVEIRKSQNPQAKVSTSGYNLTEDGREYYIAVFEDSNNPFAAKKSRVISQQLNNQGVPEWKAASPHAIKQYLGKEIAGNFVTAKVEPYDISGRIVDIYTAVVLGHENVETVFKNSGHPLLDTNTGEIKSEKVVNNILITETL